MGIFESMWPLSTYNSNPKDTPEAIMDAVRAMISAQGISEVGDFVTGLPKARLESKNLDLRNQLLSRQLAQMPMDSTKLEDQWNDEPTATSKIAKMLGTHYLEGITNPINKVGKYASRPTGIAAILARL